MHFNINFTQSNGHCDLDEVWMTAAASPAGGRLAGWMDNSCFFFML